MTDFHVLVPTATTNLITNPSFEIGTDNWNAIGSTLSQVNTRARFGRFSMKIVTDGLAINEGAYFRIDATGINSLMAGSVYIRGAGKIRLRVIDGFKGGSAVSKTIYLTDNRWQRIEVVGRVGNSNDYRLYIETISVQGITFYIDGAQLEAQAQATTYCDGTQNGCRWNGVSHASSSQRNATEMSGGTWTPIRDEECEPNTYVTIFGGFGSPPVRINRQQIALASGSVFDNAKIEERVLSLTIWVKDSAAQNEAGRSQLRIKELRQILTDLVKLDKSPNTEPFYLKVTDGDGIPLIIKCRYEGGLEFNSDARDKWKNTIPLRLLCLDPFWEEDDQEVAILATENDLGDNLANFASIDGIWESAFNEFENAIGTAKGADAIAEDKNGRMYFGGSFTADGLGNPLRRFGSSNDDFSLIIERATGLDNTPYDIKAHPNGKIYICGAFQNDNAGNPFDRIVEYDPIAGTFSALAGGIDNDMPYKMFVAPNGNLYVVGSFTTVDGAPANKIAYWDGGSWHTVGNISAELDITNLTINDLYVESDDEIYVVCYSFLGGGDNTLLAKWDGSGWTALHVGTDASGNSPIARAIIKDVDGTYIYCGEEEEDAASLANFGKVWRWNGSSYTQLGENFGFYNPVLNATIYQVKLHPDGTIYCGGQFQKVGSLYVNSPVAIWNGSTWVPNDLAAVTTNGFQEIFIRENGDIYLAMNTALNDVTAAAITYVYNRSTADVYPIITITGTGRIVRLENHTTGQRIYFDYVLQEDEYLEIDFREGEKTITSNYRGSVPDAILPNSDDFFLAAGDIDSPRKNVIGLLLTDEVEPTAQLRYTPVHWSIDAGAN